MMDDSFLLTFPMYALLLKDGTGTIFFRHGENILLPLFTDKDAVQTFLERSEIQECLVQELQTAANLGAFLRNPPSRSGNNDVCHVIFDPLDPGPREVNAFTFNQVLASLPTGS